MIFSNKIKFNNLKFRLKFIFFPAFFVIVVALIFGTIEWSNFRTRKNLNEISTRIIPYNDIANKLLTIQSALQKSFQDGVAAQDYDLIDQTIDLAEEFRFYADSAISLRAESDHADMDSTLLVFNNYYDLAVASSKLMIADDFSEDAGLKIQQMVEELNVLKGFLDKIEVKGREEIAEAFAFANNQQVRLLLIIISVLLVSLGLFLSFSILLSRSVVGALKDITNRLLLLSEGNLDIVIPQHHLEGKDEVGDMSRAIEVLVSKLTEVISGVQRESDIMSSISMELSQTSETIAEGSNEQAASVEEVSSTMEEFSSNIDQSADYAIRTEKVAVESAKSMRQVSQAAIESLESVTSIADKISIINDIAFQTNILALNAAVEAARAGEHGRGFSVVAAEVRKLAERSKTAAEEIISLATKSVEQTQNSKDLTLQIIPEVEKTAEWIQEISSSSMEQRNGVGQVNESVHQLNQIAQQNAAASEQMASSAEGFIQQSNKLSQLIGYFRIKN